VLPATERVSLFYCIKTRQIALFYAKNLEKIHIIMVKLKCAVLGNSKMHRDIARYLSVKVIIALWGTMNPLIYLYRWNDIKIQN